MDFAKLVLIPGVTFPSNCIEIFNSTLKFNFINTVYLKNTIIIMYSTFITGPLFLKSINIIYNIQFKLYLFQGMANNS